MRVFVPAVKKPDRLEAPRIGGVENRHAVAEHVADVEVLAVEHDLHAVGPAALIAIREVADLPADAVGRHRRVHGGNGQAGGGRGRGSQREQPLQMFAAGPCHKRKDSTPSRRWATLWRPRRLHAPRHRLGSCRVLLFLAAALAQSAAPNGEAVYRQHCAGCHNGTMPRMPNRDALKTLTPEHVETALSSFSMRRQGAALTLPERRAVAEYVTGRPAGSYRAPLEVIPKSAYCAAATAEPIRCAGVAWNGFGGDARNTRFQPAAAAGVSPTAVPRLKLKWAFGFPGVSASGSQVTVAATRAFVGSRNGVVYALDARSGCIVWAFEADAGVRSTPVVGGIGDDATRSTSATRMRRRIARHRDRKADDGR